eukprot:TRINITY_DN17506_c0_g1_i1.p1 TRINITY_DN17506_c0_g1~~TRINITY_DN17506_c0_g1_i1.p1  ORF type:complete len:219 (-),score=20.77 TRINITY_DN17506_c0_g1_i1:174-830(-)
MGMDQSIAAYNLHGQDSHKSVEPFTGHPWGKRPDALMKTIVVRFTQLMERESDKVQAEMQSLDEASRVVVSSSLQVISSACNKIPSGTSQLRATQCFRVVCTDDEGLQCHKYIFCMTAETSLMTAFRTLPEVGFGRILEMYLEQDSAPRGGRSKKVHGLLQAHPKAQQLPFDRRLRSSCSRGGSGHCKGSASLQPSASAEAGYTGASLAGTTGAEAPA